MSMDSVPHSSYTIEINKDTMEKLILDFDDGHTSANMSFETLKEFCQNAYDNNIELEVNVRLRDHKYKDFSIYGYVINYDPDSGSQYDEIDNVSVWIAIVEESIYERQYTPAGKLFADNDLFPELRRWDQWG